MGTVWIRSLLNRAVLTDLVAFWKFGSISVIPVRTAGVKEGTKFPRFGEEMLPFEKTSRL